MRVSLLLGPVLMSGCVTVGPKEVTIGIPFNADQARSLIADGSATLRGNAFMRQQGGGVVTCAGSTVWLVPATAYAYARFSEIYGRSTAGYSNREVRFVPDESDYYTFARQTRCDAAGNFQFERVAAGEFFVTTTVRWMAGYVQQGGNIMQRVELRSDETKAIVMSP